MSATPTTTAPTHADDLLTVADPVTARDIAYNTLTAAGFSISPSSEFEATCERGSAAMTALFGLMAGSKRQFLRLNVSVLAAPGGNGSVVRVVRGSSGAMSGVIGVARARKTHRVYRDQIAAALPR